MKKGFTLLELLAVIVVLAIIALVVTPFVTEAIENSRKGAFKSSVYGLKDAAELYCGQELTKNGGVFNGETFTVSNGELVSTTNPNNKLKFKGSSPVGESSVTISDDCQVTLNVTNGTYFASLEPGEVNVTITEEELASREELANEIASLTARINQIESINTNQTTSISNLNNLTSNLSDRSSSAEVYGSLNQSIPNGVITKLTGYTPSSVDSNYYTPSADGITVNTAGYYLIVGYISTSTSAPSTSHLYAYSGDNSMIYSSSYLSDSWGGIDLVGIAYLSVGTKINLRVINYTASTVVYSRLTLTYLY